MQITFSGKPFFCLTKGLFQIGRFEIMSRLKKTQIIVNDKLSTFGFNLQLKSLILYFTRLRPRKLVEFF